MPNKVFLLLSFLLVSVSSVAQSDSTSSKASYFLSIHAGGLLGKKGNGSTFTTSLIQGVHYKRFGLGVGIGYDAYIEWRTLPVFGSLTYDFARVRNNAFFAQLNIGHSKAWYPAADDDQFTFTEEGGYFFHPSVGYRIETGKISLYLSAGYKTQRLAYEQTPKWWIWGHPSGKVFVERDVERFSLQMGLGFR